MIIYEVNLTVESDKVNEHSAWLEEHIREMLALDGFESAALYARSGTGDEAVRLDTGDAGGDPADGDAGDSESSAAPERVPEGQRHWTIHYHLTGRDALDRYLAEDAEAMREKSTSQLGDDFDAERRVLESRKVFSQ